MRACSLVLAASLAVATRASAQLPDSATAPACPTGRVALVLPGGGVRGMAHVGVIQMMDSLGIAPDFIVGTSMGAIVGALYASGYDGHEIERLTRAYDLGAFVGRYAPQAPRALGDAPPLLLWESGEGGLDLETAAAQEARVNFLVAALVLRGNLVARGDFDRLPIPFRAVATDLRTGARVTLGSGDLAEAVRASFAIPLVFDPITLGGRVLVDGGIAENVPVRLARELGAERVILSTITLPDTAPLQTTGALAVRVTDLLFDQSHPPLGPDDIEVRSDVAGALALDFSVPTVRAMVARGREAGRALAGARCMTRRGDRRPSAVPPPIAASLTTPDAPSGSRDFLARALGLQTGRAPHDVPFDTLQARLARLGESETVRALWLRPTAMGDSVAFTPAVRRAPRRVVGAGLVYDEDLGGRAWLGAVDRQLGSLGLEGAVRGSVGEFRQDLHASARPSVDDVRERGGPFALVVLTREDVRRFTSRGIPYARNLLPRVDDQRLFTGFDRPYGARAALQVGAVVRHWHVGRQTFGGGGRGGWAAGGALSLASAEGDARSRLEAEWTSRYWRAAWAAGLGADIGRAHVAGSARFGAASYRTPPVALFRLGGDEGFAGLRIGERLGYSEISGTVDAGYPLLGPLRAHVTAMGGQTSADADRPLRGAWLAGIRAGIGAETPIGPVRVQYGVNTERRSQWYLRLGWWF